MVDYVAIGRRVKKYRLQAKLTQSDLAEKLDVSVGFVSQIDAFKFFLKNSSILSNGILSF